MIKRLSSFCICIIFSIFFVTNMFVNTNAYASISLESEFLQYWSSYGVQSGIPYLPSYYQNLVGWSTCVDKWNEFCEYNYANTFYYSQVNKTNNVSSLSIYKYDYLLNNNVTGSLKFNSFVKYTLSTSVMSSGLLIVTFSVDFSQSSSVITISNNPSNIVTSNIDYYVQFSGASASVDNSYDISLTNLLGKANSFSSFLLNKLDDLTDFVFNNGVGSFLNGLLSNNSRYLKNVLNTNNDSDIYNVLSAYCSGTLRDVTLSNNSTLSDSQITIISNTLRNLQNVYNNNVDVEYNTQDNKYYITYDTSYDNYTSEQITDYYNMYIAYNYYNSYDNYNIIDFSTTNNILSLINANIISCNMSLQSIVTSITSLTTSFSSVFSQFFIDLQSIFDDFIFSLDTTINNSNNSSSAIDLTSITDILTNINTDINAIVGGFADIDAHFNALCGVVAGAIGVAWADIKGELELMINGINFDFGNITIGDSSTSDDDYIDDTEFFRKCKSIIISKIPLLSECIEVFEDITNICIDDIDTADILEDSHTPLLSERYSFFQLYSDNDNNKEVSVPIFFGLLYLQTEPCYSVKSQSFTLFNSEFSFEMNLDYYYNNYRVKVSNILLCFSYLCFAWSIIRRSAKLFGHSAEKE